MPRNIYIEHVLGVFLSMVDEKKMKRDKPPVSALKLAFLPSSLHQPQKTATLS